MSSCVQHPCYGWEAHFVTLVPILWILFSFHPFFCDVLWALKARVDLDVSTMSEYSVTYSLHFEQLWVSTLTPTSNHCFGRSTDLRDINKYLEGSLTIQPFSKHQCTLSLGLSFCKSWFLFCFCFLFFTMFTWISSCEAGSRSQIQSLESLVTPIDGFSLLHPWAGCYCSMQGQVLGRPLISFSPSSLHSTLQHYESQSGGRKFPGHIKVDSLSPVTKLCRIFSNRTLSSSYGSQPRAMALIST